MSGYPSSVTQFWGCEISEKSSEVYEPDTDGDLSLQLTSVCFATGDAKKGEVYVISLAAEDGPPYTIAILRAGVTDQCSIDVMVGAGNEKVTLAVKGGSAKVHVTGYEILEDNGDDDFDDNFDDEDDEQVRVVRAIDADDDDDDDDDDDVYEDSDDEDNIPRYHSARYDAAALSSDTDWTPTSAVCANRAAVHVVSRTTLDGNGKFNQAYESIMTDRSLTVFGGLLERWLDFLLEQHPLLRWHLPWHRRKYLILFRSALHDRKLPVTTPEGTPRFDVPPFWNTVCARLPQPLFRHVVTYL